MNTTSRHIILKLKKIKIKKKVLKVVTGKKKTAYSWRNKDIHYSMSSYQEPCNQEDQGEIFKLSKEKIIGGLFLVQLSF